jgi:hypothetical protein
MPRRIQVAGELPCLSLGPVLSCPVLEALEVGLISRISSSYALRPLKEVS